MDGSPCDPIVINGSPHYCSYSNVKEFSSIIKGWKYDKLIFFRDEIEKKKL